MSDTSFTEKPRLVSAGQGFSILNTVSYKGRFLYSKYDPLKSITAAVHRLDLLPGTLVIICSPCLWYGLDDLLACIPQDCALCAIEADDALLELETETLAQKQTTLAPHAAPITLLSLEGINSYETAASLADRFIKSIGGQIILKRAIRLDFSAGTQFAPESYAMFCSAAESLIAQFWKNRLVLTKLGRLYARNIFRNLSSLPLQTDLDTVAGTVDRPILVCGAGESLNTTINRLSLTRKDNAKQFYILAADASLPVLNACGIRPDGVIGVESQVAIEKAYIGSVNSQIPLYADITSRPQINDILGGNVIWFATKYAEAHYLDRLYHEDILTSFIPPLGSVGLVGVYIALSLRKNEQTPVFVTGLDFSFTCGATHAKGTPAHLARLLSSSRFIPVENYDASFKKGAVPTVGKNANVLRTDTIMQLYAQNFIAQFASTPALYDIGEQGVDLGIPTASRNFIYELFNKKTEQFDALTTCSEPAVDKAIQNARSQKIARFYRKEYHALTALKDLLMNGDHSEYRDLTVTLNEQLTELLVDRDYLYLHFPDGYRLSCDIGFLKRIRAEIDFFIKDISFALSRNSRITLEE